MIGWTRNFLRRLTGQSQPTRHRSHQAELPAHPRALRATYDAAQTSDENAAHWTGADIADADRANLPGIRSRLRTRSRYEFVNNPSYCGAILLTANYEVGSLEDSPGPTLEITEPGYDSATINKAWNEWAQAIDFGLKLHTSVQARVRDGECFGFLGTDPALPVDVKLNWRPFEADQCTTPYLPYNTPNRIDGIWFDAWDRPTFYDVLRHHPGGIIPDPWLYDTIPAQYITHLFRQDRPRQHRGVPEMVSSIDLWADRRRLRKATVAANEAAANISLAVETEAPAGEADEIQSGAVEIPRNSMFALPYGASVRQVAAEHPNSSYEMFDDQTLSEAGRCLTMPFNVLACNSGKTNMSAGRLDQGMWFTTLGFSQTNTRKRVVDPIFCEWYAEARRLYGWPEKIPTRVWHWPGQPYSDPAVESAADKTALSIGTLGLQEIWARKGRNWRERMIEAAQALGMDLDQYQEWIRGNIGQPAPGNPGQPRAPGAGGPPPPPGQDAHASYGPHVQREQNLYSLFKLLLATFDENNVTRADDGRFGQTGGENASSPNSSSASGPRSPRKLKGTHDTVDQLVDDSLTGSGNNKFRDYAPVSSSEAAIMQTAFGVDVSHYVHSMSESDIRHILKQHGQDAELRPDEAPITVEDIKSVPAVIASPDRVSPSQHEGHVGLRYSKQINGHLVVIEVVAHGKEKLRLKTMYKTGIKPGD